MNLFNRIFTFVVCLKLAALAIAIIVLAWTMPQETIDALQDAVNWLQDHNQDLEKALLTSGGALIALLALIVALLELLPRSGSEVKVTDLKVGDAVLSTADIALRIDEAIRNVPHVAEGRSIVRAKRKGVLVSLELHVDPEANLAIVSDDACQTVQNVLAERVHVAMLERPRVRLHYRELRLRGRPAPVRPTTPAPNIEPIPPRLPPEVAGRQTVDPSVGHASSASEPQGPLSDLDEITARPPNMPVRQVVDPAFGHTSAPSETLGEVDETESEPAAVVAKPEERISE